jgi:hypothetical protein
MFDMISISSAIQFCLICITSKMMEIFILSLPSRSKERVTCIVLRCNRIFSRCLHFSLHATNCLESQLFPCHPSDHSIQKTTKYLLSIYTRNLKPEGPWITVAALIVQIKCYLTRNRKVIRTVISLKGIKTTLKESVPKLMRTQRRIRSCEQTVHYLTWNFPS